MFSTGWMKMVQPMSLIHPSIHLHSFTQQTFTKPLLCANTCAKLYCTIENTTYSLSLTYLQVSVHECHTNNNYHPSWRGKNECIYGLKTVPSYAELWCLGTCHVGEGHEGLTC